MATPQAPELVPAQYLLSPRAAEPRTLIDILYDTAACYPEAAAIDDGTVQLTYSELISDIEASVAWLAARGIGRGDRIGIRMPSGSFALYEAILATLAVGAAYVPVDADDPDERAELVFGEANVVATVSEAGMSRGPGSSRGWRAGAPLPRDDAWIIFTSGSTGTPKGVAVTHRSAAAFVDAEAQMFLQDNPIGPGDRVLAGLSVAFDASCEEMWLAWRHGACLVPAPRSLVRSGMDLGPWLVSRDVTVVSTVPTLAALWPAEALEAVRLLIFGGESCPPELATRLAVEGREVWNTYGPTEATVVACAARLDAEGPVRIGLPLPGWDLAVVDGDGQRGQDRFVERKAARRHPDADPVTATDPAGRQPGDAGFDVADQLAVGELNSAVVDRSGFRVAHGGVVEDVDQRARLRGARRQQVLRRNQFGSLRRRHLYENT
ncbi:MAG TPA: AMP-binding protein, partial [Jatrophihabitantaceae bacterium]